MEIDRWGQGLVAARRFDSYTRWTLYVLTGMEVIAVAYLITAVAEQSPPTWAALVLLALVHSVTVVLAQRSGLRHTVDGHGLARWPLVAAAAVGAAGVVVAMTGLGWGAAEPDSSLQRSVALIFAAFTLFAFTPLLPASRLLLVSGAMAIAAGAQHLAQYGSWQGALAVAAVTAVVLATTTISLRASVVMLQSVWQTERSRQTQARLAVAEERLRFSRDLHDVYGRTLSVVAVKSELAAELVRRGRDDEAVAEITGLRRVAEDSLREVRELVTGYRRTDLATELAGARSLLDAAGVRCSVHGTEQGMDEATQEALGWVVREAVTNIVRHATATAVTVTLGSDDGGAVLEVTNDGVTPRDRDTAGRREETGAADGTAHAGTGLRGLAERLRPLGGTLEQRQTADTFTLRATLPRRAAGQPAGPEAARTVPAHSSGGLRPGGGDAGSGEVAG